MNIQTPPLRPKGMTDEVYAKIMKQKRTRANLQMAGLSAVVIGFFVFPYFFVNWKNSQGVDGMLVNKTTLGPGTKTMSVVEWERQNGKSFLTERDRAKLNTTYDIQPVEQNQSNH